MNHLSEAQLVEALYETPEAALEAHLSECAECRARFRQFQETLRGVSEYPVPERGENYGPEVWARLEPKLLKGREQPRRHWLWIATPALAALLTVAFLGGIWVEKRHAAMNASMANASRERVLLMAMSDHLERSQIVLTEFLHDQASSPDLKDEQKRARNLLAENRLLRQTALHLGDRGHAALLEDLERVLLDLANGSPETDGQDLKLLQQRVENEGLLWKVRVTSANAREKGRKL